MREPVYRLLGLLSASVVTISMGTHLGLLCALWILVCGRLLPPARVSG